MKTNRLPWCWALILLGLGAAVAGCHSEPAKPKRVAIDPVAKNRPTSPQRRALQPVPKQVLPVVEVENRLQALAGVEEAGVTYLYDNSATGEPGGTGEERIVGVQVLLVLTEGGEQSWPGTNQIKRLVAELVPGIVSDDVQVRMNHAHVE